MAPDIRIALRSEIIRRQYELAAFTRALAALDGRGRTKRKDQKPNGHAPTARVGRRKEHSTRFRSDLYDAMIGIVKSGGPIATKDITETFKARGLETKSLKNHLPRALKAGVLRKAGKGLWAMG